MPCFIAVTFLDNDRFLGYSQALGAFWAGGQWLLP